MDGFYFYDEYHSFFNGLSFISQNGDITSDIYTMGDLILGRNNEPPSKVHTLSLCFCPQHVDIPVFNCLHRTAVCILPDSKI